MTTSSSSSAPASRQVFFPRTEWAVSILCVDDCVKMLTSISLSGQVDRYAFDGVAREVKGKLMPFSSTLRMALQGVRVAAVQLRWLAQCR